MEETSKKVRQTPITMKTEEETKTMLADSIEDLKEIERLYNETSSSEEKLSYHSEIRYRKGEIEALKWVLSTNQTS